MMLVLIPFPSAFAIAPTLVNAVRYAGNGMMRQLFGDVMVPVEQVNGAPRLMNLSELTLRGFRHCTSHAMGHMAHAEWRP